MNIDRIIYSIILYIILIIVAIFLIGVAYD